MKRDNLEVAITSVKDIIAKNVVKDEAIISLKFLTMPKLNILANSMGNKSKNGMLKTVRL